MNLLIVGPPGSGKGTQSLRDTEAGIAGRLGAYEVETARMLRDLESAGLLIPVDADRPVDDVTASILASLAGRRTKRASCLQLQPDRGGIDQW
jgi:adenylate kinase family enzyme